MLWHWHPEVELTLILSEKIEYQINDATYTLSQNPSDDYEITVHQNLMDIWHKLYLHYSTQPECRSKSMVHIQRLKEILTYVHENYATDISLDNIAESTSLSKSECCRFF